MFTTTDDVGMFAVLFQLGYTPITIVVGMAMSFIGPILFQKAGDATDIGKNEIVRRITWQITTICLSLTFIVFLFALGFHEWLFNLLVAVQYRNVSYLFPWLILGGGFFAAGQLISLKILSDLKSKELTIIKIVTAIFGVFLNIWLARIAGLNGIIIALIIFSLVYFIWAVILVLKTGSVEKE